MKAPEKANPEYRCILRQKAEAKKIQDEAKAAKEDKRV